MGPEPLERLVRRHPSLAALSGALETAQEAFCDAAARGATIYVCGNGGSAADAEHIVGELMKGMGQRRPLGEPEQASLRASVPEGFQAEGDYLAEHLEAAVRAVCLSSQSALLTAVANDTGGDMGFAQQVYAYGRPGDLLVAISTSGRSRNVVLAALAARARRCQVLALTGLPGGPLRQLADIWLGVPAEDVAAVQELHRPVYHALCECLEEWLLSRPRT